ncbi:uncharacterized protein LOC131695040 [Topomyia yanbarensis]|uniref:uncharacterized protein LOC131695040 n=1 Tax=Topomyia yanbarensis TaxID=2498891 RepID=UPI00273A7ACE|nr:uncharacterized protein LOC131695040 [Topomyia yanbarensis]
MEFLRKRCLILERCESTTPALSSSKQASSKAAPPTKAFKISAAATTSTEITCELCGGDHPNFKCSAFKNMSIAQRLAKVREVRVCFNCLRKGHMIRACPSQRTCAKCNQKHHSMLHQDQPESFAPHKPKDKPEEKAAEHQEATSRMDPEPQENGSVSVTTSCFAGGQRRTKQVLLQTAVIDVIDVHGRLHPCRTLLDSGSQAHILSEAMARVLGFPTLKCNITVVGANAVKTQVKKGLNLNFSSRYCDLQDSITCLISDKPTGIIPSVAIDVSSWSIPPELQLADPDFFKPRDIDLVLASNYVWDLIRTKKVVLANGTASLRETDLGWIITGTFDPYQQVSANILLSNVTMHDDLLDEQLERFWYLEEVVERPSFDAEEQEVEQHFLETYCRDESGRFVVQMPFRETVTELEDNRSQAILCLRKEIVTQSRTTKAIF